MRMQICASAHTSMQTHTVVESLHLHFEIEARHNEVGEGRCRVVAQRFDRVLHDKFDLCHQLHENNSE